jgi:hypothetical protein
VRTGAAALPSRIVMIYYGDLLMNNSSHEMSFTFAPRPLKINGEFQRTDQD